MVDVFSSFFPPLSYCCCVMMYSVSVAVPSPSASAVFKEKVIMPPRHTLIDAVLRPNKTLVLELDRLDSLVDVNSSDSISLLKSQVRRDTVKWALFTLWVSDDPRGTGWNQSSGASTRIEPS